MDLLLYHSAEVSYKVGRKVRHTMEEISGTLPENLKIAEDITLVKRGLKKARREFEKIDSPQSRKRLTD